MCDCEQVVGLLTEIRDLLAQHAPPVDADRLEVRGD